MNFKGFKIRHKPIKPTRKVINRAYDVCCGLKLSDIIHWVNSVGVVFENVEIVDHGWDYPEYHFVCQAPETDEELNKRTEKYKKDLEKYNKWFEKNKKKIELFEEESKKKQEKTTKDKKKNINKKIEKLQKELEQLK